MKKILSLLLSVVLLATMSMTAFAAEDPYTLKINGTEYTAVSSLEDCITSSGVPTNTITSLEILSGKIVSADWNYFLTQSGGGATPNMSQSLETVYISNDVVLESMLGGTGNELGFGAFQYDGKLKTAYVGSAEVIADMAFLGCESLIQVTAPLVKTIAADAFEDCKSLAKLNLPATPPKAGNFANTPADKSLGFVSADGTALTGKALTDAISAYKAVDDGDTTDNYWYGFKISDKNYIAPSDSLGNGKGDTPLTMSGVAIPAPTYTVTIPKTIEFAGAKRVLAETPDNKKLLNTDFSVTAITNNLFVNEKQLTVSVLTDLTMKDKDDTTLAYTVKLADEQIAKNTAKTILTVSPIEKETVEQTNTIALTATLDQSTIKKASTYNGTVTFTVALSDIA